MRIWLLRLGVVAACIWLGIVFLIAKPPAWAVYMFFCLLLYDRLGRD